MLNGVHPIHRKLLDHWLWTDKPFAKGQAWVDLILLANHNRGTAMINGSVINVEKGQVFRSKLTLGKRWGWSRGKIERFLNLLEKHEMLVQRTVQHGTLLTLLNYNKLHKIDFKDGTTGRTPDGTTAGQRQDTYKEELKKNKKNNINPCPKSPKPEPSIPQKLLGHFCENYLQRIGHKYMISYGKELKLIKDILKAYDNNEQAVHEIIDGFFEMEKHDEFLRGKLTVSMLYASCNKVVIFLREGRNKNKGRML